MKVITYCFLLTLCTATSLSAQSGNPAKVVINLSGTTAFSDVIGGFTSTTVLRDEKEYKFDKSGWEKFIVKRFAFDVTDGRDFTDLSGQGQFENYVDILIAKTPGDSTLFIVDKNRNKSFMDEETIISKFDPNYRFKNADYAELKPLLETTLSYERIGNGTVERASFPVMLLPFKYGFSYTDPIENELYFMVYANDYRQGNFTVGGKKYQVLASKNGIGPFYLSDRSRFYFGDDKRVNESEYKLKDVITLGTANYRIDSISRTGSVAYLSLDSEEKMIGNRVNKYLPEGFFEEQLNTHELMVVEFWGTWCIPCVNGLPEVNRSIRSFRSKKIGFVAVDYESSEPVKASLVREQNLDWTMIKNETSPHNYVKFLDLTQFPTFLVVDKQRKILFRDAELSALNDFLKTSEIFNSK